MMLTVEEFLESLDGQVKTDRNTRLIDIRAMVAFEKIGHSRTGASNHTQFQSEHMQED
jgi:hypothetical protein